MACGAWCVVCVVCLGPLGCRLEVESNGPGQTKVGPDRAGACVCGMRRHVLGAGDRAPRRNAAQARRTETTKCARAGRWAVPKPPKICEQRPLQDNRGEMRVAGIREERGGGWAAAATEYDGGNSRCSSTMYCTCTCSVVLRAAHYLYCVHVHIHLPVAARTTALTSILSLRSVSVGRPVATCRRNYRPPVACVEASTRS